MKIENGNYFHKASFTDDEVNKFIELTGVDLDGDFCYSEYFERYDLYDLYGLNSQGDLRNWCNGSSYGKNNKDITEDLRKYLDSLEGNKEDKVVTSYSDNNDDNLSVKERLLALREGKELQYIACSKLDGSVSFKVRIMEKDPINEAFEEYCFDNNYDPNELNFYTFKAGYEAAKSC